MLANRPGKTRLEIELRSTLWKLGVKGFRKDYKALPGSPDIYFPKYKLAVFVHGCFWHSCPSCKKTLPKSNRQFWEEKFGSNIARDARVESQLKEGGIRVLVVWECSLKKLGYQAVAETIISKLDVDGTYKAS